MSKQFSQEELAEMRADLERNPGYKGLGVVAQLHACKRADVIAALGLDPADYARKPQVKVTPEQRADAVARAARGEALKDIAQELGVGASTVSTWVTRAKAAEVAQVEAPAHTAVHPPVRLSAVAQSYLEDLDAAIDYMSDAQLLDDEDKRVLEQYLTAMAAFVRGLEYAEEHMERSAE